MLFNVPELEQSDYLQVEQNNVDVLLHAARVRVSVEREETHQDRVRHVERIHVVVNIRCWLQDGFQLGNRCI